MARDPRFRWTPALHQAFEAAAQELGGYDHCIPSAILERLSSVQGITMAHVKSHLQKCRNDIRVNAWKTDSGSGRPGNPVSTRRLAIERHMDAQLAIIGRMLPRRRL